MMPFEVVQLCLKWEDFVVSQCQQKLRRRHTGQLRQAELAQGEGA